MATTIRPVLFESESLRRGSDADGRRVMFNMAGIIQPLMVNYFQQQMNAHFLLLALLLPEDAGMQAATFPLFSRPTRQMPSFVYPRVCLVFCNYCPKTSLRGGLAYSGHSESCESQSLPPETSKMETESEPSHKPAGSTQQHKTEASKKTEEALELLRESGIPAPIHRDPYSLLGLPRGASKRDVCVAYRKLALKFHPDKTKMRVELSEKDRKVHEEAFKLIASAYDMILNPEKYPLDN
jgi:hypothetical protein